MINWPKVSTQKYNPVSSSFPARESAFGLRMLITLATTIDIAITPNK